MLVRQSRVELKLDIKEAREIASKRFKEGHLNLDYAYIHACHSFDDKSLAHALVRPGGIFWGEKGLLWASEGLYEYKRP
jgi:hypothetical protein